MSGRLGLDQGLRSTNACSTLGVILGAYYGPVVFLAVFGSLVGGLALLIDKKVYRSIQFGEYSFWKRTLGQFLAFLIAGAIVAVIVAARFNLLYFGQRRWTI